MIRCKNCGRENEDSFRFCLDCGTNLKPAQTNDPPSQTLGGTIPPPSIPPAASESPKSLPRGPVVIEPIIVHSTSSPPAPSATAAPRPSQAGASTVMKTVCQTCGNAMQSDDLFCPACGQHQGRSFQQGGGTVFLHVASPALSQQPKARLVLIQPDGNEGAVFNLTGEKTLIGREHGAIMFPKDPFISPQHAEITFKDGQITLTDLDSQNGVYWKMTGETRIIPGTYFRIGRQLLRLEVPGDLQPFKASTPADDDSQFWGSPVPQIWARLVQILEGGKIGEIYLLSLAEVALGRDVGEVRFPGDVTVSARHCLLANREGDCFLRDLGSSNGTFLRVQKTQPLRDKDRIQIGTQVLRIDLQ